MKRYIRAAKEVAYNPKLETVMQEAYMGDSNAGGIHGIH